MDEKQVVIGIFENALNALIAKRDLRIAGINANILREECRVTLYKKNQEEGVKILVPEPQEKMAKDILQTRFL